MLIVEFFSHIQNLDVKAVSFAIFNITLMVIMVHGLAKYFRLKDKQIWFWYVLCLTYAPFFELLQIGQINMITMFGIFIMVVWDQRYPIIGGVGISIGMITKVTPTLFFISLFINKRYKTILCCLSLVLILIGLSIARYGTLPILEYPDVFKGLLAQIPISENSQSIASKISFIGKNLGNVNLQNHPLLQVIFNELNVLFTLKIKLIQRILGSLLLSEILFSAFLVNFGKQRNEPLLIITTISMMLSANIMWYHHYVFLLLALLIWMGWYHLDPYVVVWCVTGLLLVQVDRFSPPYGLLIHLFCHLSIMFILFIQVRDFLSYRKLQKEIACV